MPRQIIKTANAPSSPFYSQGVRAGPHLFLSGIVGIDPGTDSLADDTIQGQTRQALRNCEAILHAGGATLDDVIEVGILLADPADFVGLNEEYVRWFPSDPPTRYVAKLGVELPGIARLDPHHSFHRLMTPRDNDGQHVKGAPMA